VTPLWRARILPPAKCCAATGTVALILAAAAFVGGCEDKGTVLARCRLAATDSGQRGINHPQYVADCMKVAGYSMPDRNCNVYQPDAEQCFQWRSASCQSSAVVIAPVGFTCWKIGGGYSSQRVVSHDAKATHSKKPSPSAPALASLRRSRLLRLNSPVLDDRARFPGCQGSVVPQVPAYPRPWLHSRQAGYSSKVGQISQP